MVIHIALYLKKDFIFLGNYSHTKYQKVKIKNKLKKDFSFSGLKKIKRGEKNDIATKRTCFTHLCHIVIHPRNSFFFLKTKGV